MKKLSLAIIALFCLVAFSCHKENQVKPKDFFVAANLADSSWVAKPVISYIASDSLQVQGVQGGGSSTLAFKIKFSGVGTYSINRGQANFFVALNPTHGGGPILEYLLDNTQTNTVTITQYNPATQIATGTFQLNFITGGGGKTLSLTSGQFWIALPNE